MRFFIGISLLLSLFGGPCNAQDSRCDELQSFFIPKDITICRLDTLRFDREYGFSVLWSDSTTKPFFIVRDTGMIWVRHFDPSATCTPNFRQDTITIRFYPKPQFDSKLKIDTTLCFGDSISLAMPKPINAEFYTWSDPTLNDSIIRDSLVPIVFNDQKFSSNLYPYTATAIGFCWRRAATFVEYIVYDTAYVFFSRKPEVNLGNDTTLCPTQKFSAIALDPTLFLHNRYGITWDGTPSTQNEFSIDTTKPGLHVISIGHRCGDTITDSVTVNFWPPAWTHCQLISDTGVCESIEITLDASSPFPLTHHFWEDDSSTNPIRTIDKPGTYSVVLTDSAGCKQTFVANVTNDDCKPLIEFPNVFTPNGDQVNDLFVPLKTERVYNFRFAVFNRYGNRVFFYEGDPEKLSWDGKNGSKIVPAGLYYYVCKYDDVFGKRMRFKENIQILK